MPSVVPSDSFLRTANLLPEAMLLLAADGTILAANTSCKHRLGLLPQQLRGRRLHDLVVDPPDVVDRYLQTCAESKELSWGSLVVDTGDGTILAVGSVSRQPCRCGGAAYRTASAGTDALILLRLMPKDTSVSQVATLNQQIDELSREIIRRRRAEEELRRFKFISDHANDIHFFANVDGRLLYVNRVACERLGYSEAELLARNIYEIGTNCDQTGFRRLFEEAQQRRLPPFESEFRSKDGTQFPVSLAVNCVEFDEVPYLFGVARDITERKLAEQTLRASEQRFRAIIENGWDVVVLISPDATIRYASPSVVRIAGFTSEELVGRNGFEFIHPDDLERVRDILLQLLQQPSAQRTTTYRSLQKDGSWQWIEATGTNLLADPAIGAIVVNYHDVTAYKSLEAALKERAEKLAEADRRKDVFLATLGHELRNPLAPILHATHLLQLSGVSDSERQWAREVIARQTKHLSRLVDDLLDVSRITAGKVQLQKQPVELASVLNTALEAIRPLLSERRQELTVRLPPEPVRLDADPVRLAQIVSNLLNNAHKYTPDGGHISLHAGRDGSEVEIRVRDDGIGIPSELLNQVFDLFTQGDRSLARSKGGLGIGLTLVRSLVQMHGGTVRATSDGTDKGSEFIVRLPALD
jgi:PAS domain S-box-containing protein